MSIRPAVLLLVSLALLTGPPPAEAQQPATLARIGCLETGSASGRAQLWEAFRQGLRDLGYVEGQNISLECRWGEGNNDRLPGLAAELARLKVAVIVASATPAARAAQQATPTIPIVVTAVADPVGSGLVASLARPGGNVTGLSMLAAELVAKRLELLKEVVPKVARMAVLWHPGVHGEGTIRNMLEETKSAGRALGVQLQFVEVRRPDGFERAFAAIRKERVGALLVFPSPMFIEERRRIVAQAAKSRLPAVYPWRESAEAGGLMSYGVSLPDQFRRAATYVDKIPKGAKPADLPVEQPTRFELVINLKTAKALGLTIPPSILIRADQVIQ